MTTIDSSSPPRRAQAGFTLLEAIISVAIMVVILVGLLTLLEFNGRVAKAQVNVSEMQQSLRAVQSDMVRYVRMAGRGGLPAFRPADAVAVYPGMLLPNGAALAVDNNTPAGTTLGGNAAAAVAEGTDILTVRGVISTILYQVNPAGDGTVAETGADSITVRSVSPAGVLQDLEALKTAITHGRPEALLLVSSLEGGIQAVVQLTGGQDNGDSVVLSYTRTDDYDALSPKGSYPKELTTVAAIGILEEVRYYIRDAPGGRRLARARFYPGTETAYADEASNLTVDLADNIQDLQVALGIDRNATETIEDTGDGADDWLFNSADDSPVDPALWNASGRPLYYLRLTTLARTDRADLKYVSPPIQAIEDHVYDEPAEPADGAARQERTYRRRILQTVVDLRNLS